MAAISVSKKRQLVAVLSDIPLVTWNTIVKKEPEWERMEPLARRWHFGPFVVLMVATGLNDYQLEGKAEVVYWPKLRDLFDRYPSPGCAIHRCWLNYAAIILPEILYVQ